MQFAFSEEQNALRATARAFLAEHSASEPMRRAMQSELGYAPELWKTISAELGWPAVSVPEAYGGLGLGAVELAALLEAMGETLLCAPFFSSVCLGANALLVAGSDAQKREQLPAIAEGRSARDAGRVRARQELDCRRDRGRSAPARAATTCSPAASAACSTDTAPTCSWWRRAARDPGETRASRCSPFPPRARASSVARFPRSIRPGASPRSSCTACACRRVRGSAKKARARPLSSAFSSWPRSRWRPSRWAVRSAASISRWRTPRAASSSAVRSAPSRRSSTAAPT